MAILGLVGLAGFAVVVAATVVFMQALAFLCEPPGTLTLNVLALLAVGIQWLVFVHASGAFGNPRTEKYFDLTGGFTFATLSALSLSNAPSRTSSSRQLLLTVAVIVWAVRLGLFLFWRVCKHGGRDSRFDPIRPGLFRFWSAWTMQGMWTFVTALPVYAINTTHQPPLGLRDFLGLGIFLFGFLFEVVADYQKTVFRFDPNVKEQKFITHGLWALTRHPNYFGEIVLWFGICISASAGFTAPTMWAAAISPFFVTTLLIFGSGLPLVEASANKKFGDDPAYQGYKKRTPILIPKIGRAGDAKF